MLKRRVDYEPEAKVPETRLELIHNLIHHCDRCPLHRERIHAVPGSGPESAKIFMLGEGPGKNEDEQGQPFVGRAGKLLDELLASVEMTKQDVYITNIIKCRAPGNRDPLPEEQEACSRFLRMQLTTLEPLLVVTMGQFAFSHFLPGEPIGKARGRLRNVGGQLVYPVIHPAAALRRGDFHEWAKEDFLKLPAILEQAKSEPPAEENPKVRTPRKPPNDEERQPTLI